MKITTILSILAIAAFSCNTPNAPVQAAETVAEKTTVAEVIEEPEVVPTIEIISGTVVGKKKPTCACNSFVILKVKGEKVITCSDELKDGCMVGGNQKITPSEGDRLTYEGYYETYTCEDGKTEDIFTVKKCTIDQVIF